MRVRWVPVVVAPALVLLLWWSLVFLCSEQLSFRWWSLWALCSGSGCILCYFANLGKMGSAPTYAPTHPHTHIHAYTRNNF